MPIRRAAATPPQEKALSAAAEKEDEATPVEESPPTNESPVKASAPEAEAKESTDESEPTENGENGEKDPEEGTAEDGKNKETDKCKDCLAGQCTTHCYVLLLRLKDGYKYKSKVKKVKRTIPAWASVSSNKKVPVTNYAGTQHRLDNILVEAITSFNSRSGVSYQSLMKYLIKKYPSMELDRKKFLIKKAMKKQLGNGAIKQLKGKGLSGTFAIGKVASASKKTPQNTESLGDALPLIITRLCEPKEASFGLIKKYLMQHFPALNIEKRPDILKTALGRAIEKGQVEQITGKGACGTFQLKRSGNQIQLKGSTLDDAIVAAITAMNEPKTCSTTILRKHLLDVNKDRKEHILVSSLRRTLTKCKVLGWMEQITGHGFTGTYRLSFPYYPGPTVLYPDRFKDLEKPAAPKRRKARSDESESEESEESEEEESEDEAPVRSRSKRPPPKVRRPPPSKSRSAGRSKSKGRKSSPVKKVALSKKAASKPAASKKASSPAKKATPVKKSASAKKPKTPAVKKLASRAAKRPPPKDLSSDEEEDDEEEEEEEIVPKKTAKGRSSRSKPEESPAPPAKKQATKSNSRAAAKQSKPAAKKGAKSSAQSSRKSKRGRR